MQDSLKVGRLNFARGNFYACKRGGDTSYGLHWHEYYEMILYRDCHGVCFLNGVEYPIDGTSLLFRKRNFKVIDFRKRNELLIKIPKSEK